MSDIEFRDVLGLPKKEEQPPTRPLFESPPQVPEAFPFAPRPLDPWREYLGLPTSPMYRRKKGIIPEPPDPEDPAQDLMAILATSDNPELEIAKINAALSVAENLKLDPRQVYVNLEALSEHWYGKILQPPVFAQQLRDAWDNGMMNYNIGKLALRLREAGGEDEELIKQIREIESAMKPMTDIPRPWIQNAMMWAMESSPLMAQSFLRGGVTGAATGAVAGAMYGAVGAPLTGGLSVPAMTLAMASVGFAVGMTQDFMEIGRGLAYWRHHEQGVPHNIAAPLGDIEGVITGAIESIGSILIGLKIPGLTPALKSAGTLVANKMMATGVVSAIATRLIGQVGGVGLAEGIEEPLQELTAIFMDQLARELSKNQDIVTTIEPITLQNVIQRTGQAFYTGMSAGLVFGMVGAPGGISADVRQLSTIREIAEKAPTRLGFINTIIRGDYVLQETGASETAWREYLGKVWDKQHPGKAPVAAVPVTAEGAPAPRAAVVRTPEERLYTQVEERTRTREGVTAVLKAGDPTTGQRYGYVQYETVGDRIYIEDVVNETETDMRRELVLDLAARYPGQEIEWNPTDELDVALQQDLIATNPRGAEYGLQRFEAAATPAAQQELTRGLFVQRMGELFTADTPEQAEFYGKLTDVIAKVSGQTTEEWLRKYISPEVTATTEETKEALAAGRGVAATRFMVEGRPISPLAVDLEEFKGQVKAVFTALGKADFHTGVHEFFHAVERLALSPDQIKKFETALGKLRETWTTEDIEKLADYFEDYLATGKAPTPELQTVFQQIAAALKELISFLKERLGGEVRLLSPEFEKAYDSLFARPDSGLAQARAEAPPVAPIITSQVEEGIEPSAEDAVTIIHPSAVPPQEIELSRIILSKEVPNFKEMADKRGIIEPLLAEEYVKVGIPPIVLWERLNGILEIITGRHRLDLAQRLKLPTILSQIVREADGFTAVKAMTFDAESNIRDGQGSVRDYANYFKNSEITEQEASRRGLLDRHKGRTGFAIGRYAADGLYSLYRNNQISETKAAAIAAASLGDERLQGLGISKSKKLSADELGNFIALARQQVTTTEGVQSDMFGFDDTLIREGEKIAKAVSAKKAELLQERQALSSALRLSRGAQAKIVEKYGFKAGDVAAIQDRVDVLGAELVSWENWTQDPQKMREARTLVGLPVAKELLHPEGEEPPEPPGFELTAWDDKLLRPKEKATQPIFGFAEERDVGLKDWTKTKEGWQHISGKMADKALALELTRMKDLADNLSLFHRDEAAQKEFNKAAVKIFGTTDDPELAGWILSDGKMLDFDWNKHENKPRYLGRIYHVEIAQVFKLIDPKQIRYFRGAYSGAWQAGAIRIDTTHPGDMSFQSTMVPNLEQMKTIEYTTMGKRRVFLEIMAMPKGKIDYERSVRYEKLEAPDMRDIRQFYTRATATLAQRLQLFHTEDELLYKSIQIINAKMQGPMQTKQLKAMLVNGGVKADEMKWTGLDEFLEEDRKVTPEEVQEFIENNAVRVQEVRLETRKPILSPEVRARIEELEQQRTTAGLTGGVGWPERYRLLNDEIIRLRQDPEAYHEAIIQERYDDLDEELVQLRVEALNLLERGRISQVDRFNMVDAMTWNLEQDQGILPGYYERAKRIAPDFRWEALNETYAQWEKTAAELDITKQRARAGRPQYTQADYRLVQGENYREILLTMPTAKPPFTSGHFERTPNILAWARVQDVKNVEGNTVLMVEEIQSDWHQRGREEGYLERPPVVPELIIRERALEWVAVDESGLQWGTVGKGVMATREEATEYLNRYIREREAEAAQKQYGKVPPAPFAKTWHELTFRRMLREAVEGGYDALAWTTGEQQNERWNLAKYVDRIIVHRIGDDLYNLVVFPKNAGNEQTFSRLSGKELGNNYIGKELAQRVTSQKEDIVEVGGLDLQIGGKGMIAFYDKMLGDYANKLGKKWGVQVEETKIADVEGTFYERGYPLRVTGSGNAWAIEHEGGTVSAGWATRESAEKTMKEWQERYADFPTHTVHSLPVNEAMKKGVAVGQISQLFHPDDWQGNFLYGTEIDAEIYQQYVDLAKGYETAEAFRADMEEKYGEPGEADIAGEAATRFYQETWDEAHRPTPEPEAPPTVPIESPVIPGAATYDYQEKVDASRDIEDRELAAKVEAGEITEKGIDKLAGEAEAAEGIVTEKATKATEATEEALSGLTAEEQLAIKAGDELEAAMAERERAAVNEVKMLAIERRIKSFRTRLINALAGNAHVAVIMDEQGAWKRILSREAPVEEAEAYVEGITFGREIQKIIDTEKAKGVLRETKVRMYAEKRAAVEKVKEGVRKAAAQRRAAKKLREVRRKLIAHIRRPPGRSIQFKGYAEQIRLIQKGLDPTMREYRIVNGVQVMEKTMKGYAREQTRKFFEENPEAAAQVPMEKLERFYSVNLPDMTLAQLEEIADSIDRLRKLGRLKRHLELAQKARAAANLKNRLEGAVLRGEEPEKVIGRAKRTGKSLALWIQTLTPRRVLSLLDGVFAGVKEGPFTELGWKRVNEAWGAFKKAERERKTFVLNKMKELGFTLNPLAQLKGEEWVGRKFDIDGFRYTDGKMPTLQDVMYWYIGMKNERTAMALIEGNNLPAQVVMKGIAKLSEKERAMADAIDEDGSKNFARYRDAFIDTFNMDLLGEEHYVRMVRLNANYEMREDQAIVELTGRAGISKEFVARHSTYARIDIEAEHQKPIRMDLFNLWAEGVLEQEGFIQQYALVREMHNIFGSDQVMAAVKQKYGSVLNQWLKKYTNDLAQADAYRSMKGLERIARTSRKRATVAWLGFNLLSVAKQSVGAYAFMADLGPLAPAYLLEASAKLAAGSVKAVAGGHFFHNTQVDFVKERSEFVRNRQISVDLENLKHIDPGLYSAIIGKIGKWGMKGLEVMDITTVCIGWTSVYDKTMHDTQGNEGQAIEAADAATIRNSPSARVQDLAEMYRHGEILKWFTMFTSELNVIWNRLTFDMPLAVRRMELYKALSDIVSITIAGVVIAIASGALQGDDEEKRKKLILGLFQEYVDSIPLIGNDIFAYISGKQFQASGVKLIPPVTMWMDTARQLTEGDWDMMVQKGLQALSFTVGLPHTAGKRVYRAISQEYLGELLGWKKE